MSDSTRVLGVDPGTHHVGWGVVDCAGNRLHAVAWGTLDAPDVALPGRLVAIADGLGRVMEVHAPAVMAIEEAFHGKNARSAFRIGEGRAVAILLAARRGMRVAEYPPATVKKAVAGHGRAEKDQVAAMVCRLLALAAPPQHDAADALAVAICHGSRFSRDRL